MPKVWPASKDPNEVKDFEVDWSDLLDTDTISTSAWSIVDDDSTLTVGVTSKTDTTTTVWLSGGTASTTYELLNRIVTAGGRTYDQTCKLRVKDN